ncbi:hypothetical protein [Paraburkholderia silvatlantica]|uniref:Uncharacterized protein n=1 Tax=Paraburkholderia silvatlantica TaxID=321895 RepID=A0ABR6FZ69_9BURK|nr:hypothetical protein [Paraburkholderia silvatlantica]MBB2932735.1 hypothetical protein [Paraburkholderia silvatlantica]PVY21484.1 hypothetical protein C7411_13659 [Paraburkholderia silvatlantica]PXW26081.1 hypothetical protein C7413_13759 [Paraburkholderia silvatlantica]
MPSVVGFRIDEVIAIDVHVSIARAAFRRLVSYTSVVAGAIDNLASRLLQTRCLPNFAFGIYVPALSNVWQPGWFYQAA